MKRYGLIYADPAWQYNDPARAGERGASFKYRVSSLEDLCAMQVADIAEDDCALAMWATFPMYAEALRVMKAWGFAYTTCAFLWVKTRTTAPSVEAASQALQVMAHDLGLTTQKRRRFALRAARGLDKVGLLRPALHIGMGHSTRANAEPLLLGIRGRLMRQDAGVRQIVERAEPEVIHSALGEHSRKPPEFRELLTRLLGPRRRVELFARDRTPGWDAWGDQVPDGVEDVEIRMGARQIDLFGAVA